MFEEGVNNMGSKNKRIKDRENLRMQILQRKEKEIEALKEKVLYLQDECKKKDELINSVDDMRKEFERSIEDLKEKKKEFENLNKELRQMKKVFNETVFKGRWSIVKWLMK